VGISGRVSISLGSPNIPTKAGCHFHREVHVSFGSKVSLMVINSTVFDELTLLKDALKALGYSVPFFLQHLVRDILGFSDFGIGDAVDCHSITHVLDVNWFRTVISSELVNLDVRFIGVM